MDKPTWKPHDGHSGEDIHDDYGEAWKYIEHLEAMLGAGNLCEGQHVVRQGDAADTKLREATGYCTTLIGGNRYEDCLPVLIEDKAGVAVWRFYRKAGH